MRRAGAVVADVLSELQKAAKPGVTTGHLDAMALRLTQEAGAQALFKGVKHPAGRRPFPGAICASINEEVVHGIPADDRVLGAGDILSIDFGVRLNGYCGDAALTVPVGEISAENRKLIEVTEGALQLAIDRAKPGVRWSAIAGAMQQYTESAGFSVVRDFVGHGIGTKMHEDPKVPNFVSEDLLLDDIILTEGMILAVEPMINAGSYAVRTLGNGWTVVTRDGRCSAHFEHTIAIVKGGCEVLTRRSTE